MAQLCINFANEKLQNFFLRAVFKAEELAYKNDGIKWEPITYTDNSAIIDICEGKEKGIFPSLDSVCRAPKATDETLAAQLHENHARSKILCRPKAGGGGKGGKKGLTDKEAFIMKHFAGDVTYSVLGWLDKNNDKLSEDYEKHIAASSKVLLSDRRTHLTYPPTYLRTYVPTYLLTHSPRRLEPGTALGSPRQEGGGGAQGRQRWWQGQVQGPADRVAWLPRVTQEVCTCACLSHAYASPTHMPPPRTCRLLDALESTDAHFIRCIKPNNELKPNQLYGAFVLTQLKCSGTLEAVELMQRGYPSRIPYSAIHERYKSFMPDFVQALPASEFVEAIALAFGVAREDYQLGMYKIFMRAGKAAFLEELKDANIDDMVPIITKKIEEFQKKKHGKVVLERCLRTYIWRRRINKLKAMKRKAEEARAKAKRAFARGAAQKKAKTESEKKKK